MKWFWRPIRTAPKADPQVHPARLIGWLVPPHGKGGQPRAASIYWTPPEGDYRGFWFHTDGVSTEWQPTHWQPCDPPVNTQQKEPNE